MMTPSLDQHILNQHILNQHILNQHIKELTAYLAKDAELLKECEDALCYEAEPHRKVRYQRQSNNYGSRAGAIRGNIGK